MKKLRTGDPVIMISGKYKGKISTIEKFVDDNRVLVKGINEVKKAVKGKGFVKKILPVHVSNIMYYVEDQKKATKIKITTDKKGKKIREATKIKLIIK
ncbi:MAG: 50S ribosomal protein L24 [Candidatus Absconditabacterales bacterium]